MPVRIYDISKKLGLENKEVLSKAKELGIAAARVASSSLDKITAEYLEQQLLLAHPNLSAPPAPPPAPPQIAEPIVLVTAPPPPPPPQEETVREEEEPVAAVATSVMEPEAPAEPEPATLHETVETETPAEPLPVAKAPVPPPLPAGPKVGDKVGFIQLPSRPGPKPVEKPGSAKLPARPVETRPTDFGKRGDIRTVRPPGAPGGGARPGVPGARPSAPAKAPARLEPPGPPKIVLPADAQVITIKPPIVVRELAEQLKQKPFKIIADLMELGVFANVN